MPKWVRACHTRHVQIDGHDYRLVVCHSPYLDTAFPVDWYVHEGDRHGPIQANGRSKTVEAGFSTALSATWKHYQTNYPQPEPETLKE